MHEEKYIQKMKLLKIISFLGLLGLLSCHDKVKEPVDQVCFNPIDLKTEGVELVDATHPSSAITMTKDLLNPKDNLHKYGVTIAVNQKLYNLSADTIQLDSIRNSFLPTDNEVQQFEAGYHFAPNTRILPGDTLSIEYQMTIQADQVKSPKFLQQLLVQSVDQIRVVPILYVGFPALGACKDVGSYVEVRSDNVVRWAILNPKDLLDAITIIASILLKAA